MQNEPPLIDDALTEAGALRFSSADEPWTAAQESRSLAAIRRAIILRKLREEHAGTPFLSLPLDEYLKRLARMAGVSLPDAGSPFRERGGVAALRPWLALAEALEPAAEHVRLWVRAWVASTAGSAGSLHVSARGERGHLPSSENSFPLTENLQPEGADTVLTEIERGYSPEHRHRLAEALGLLES